MLSRRRCRPKLWFPGRGARLRQPTCSPVAAGAHSRAGADPCALQEVGARRPLPYGGGRGWQRRDHAARVGLEEVDREEDHGGHDSGQEPDVEQPPVEGGGAIRFLDLPACRVAGSNLGLGSLRRHRRYLPSEPGGDGLPPAAKCLLAEGFGHRPFGQGVSENG
jgi:hypothetical protein